MGVLLPLRNHGNYYVWNYVPSLPAAIIFAILWIAVSGALCWRMSRTRTWFCTAFIIGCLMEFVGYCARAAASEDTSSLIPYAMQSTFILVPPALFAATIYMCLGRIIRLLEADHLSIVRPSIMTKVFVTGDVLSFVLQASSGGLQVMASTNPSLGTLAKVLVIVGLALQLVSFSIFVLTACLFHTRIRAQPTTRSLEVGPGWTTTMYMLYGISAAIIVRSIFRIVEYLMGQSGYLLSNEWPLYVFDSALMFVSAVAFVIYYPSNLGKRAEPVALADLESLKK